MRRLVGIERFSASPTAESGGRAHDQLSRSRVGLRRDGDRRGNPNANHMDQGLSQSGVQPQVPQVCFRQGDSNRLRLDFYKPTGSSLRNNRRAISRLHPALIWVDLAMPLISEMVKAKFALVVMAVALALSAVRFPVYY